MFTLVTLAVFGASSFPSDQLEWSGFRGPGGAGIAISGQIPDSFDREQNLAWKTELPSGYSSPIVTKERVFVTAVDAEQLVTLGLDRATGKVLWRQAVDFDGSRVGANSQAAPTPATDGQRVFALFHHVGMIAYDLDGKELWKNDLGAPFNIPHGLATSPVVHEDRLIVQIDQDGDSRLVALDKGTGEVLWRVERPGVTHGYATPLVYTPEEGPAQIITSGALRITAYSATDGKELWWVDGGAWQAKALPVLYGDLCIVSTYMVASTEFGMPRMTQTWDQVVAEKDTDKNGRISQEEWPDEGMRRGWFIYDLNEDGELDANDYAYLENSGKATGGLLAIRMDGKGDITQSHVAWKYDKRRGLSHLISPVLVGDTVFLLKEGGILTAMNAATGEVGKSGRVGSSDDFYASPVTAGEEVWATPAITTDGVLVRTQVALYSFSSSPG